MKGFLTKAVLAIFAIVLILALALFFSLPTVMNPNPGQLTASNMRSMGRMDEAFELTEQMAEHGHPWAQYQLAEHYVFGARIAQNDQLAVQWFGLASLNFNDNRWSEGEHYSRGESGHFAENFFALAAQHRLAESHRSGGVYGKDLVLAYLYEQNVLQSYDNLRSPFRLLRQKLLGGTTISNGRPIVQERFDSLRAEMTESEIALAEETIVDWSLPPARFP